MLGLIFSLLISTAHAAPVQCPAAQNGNPIISSEQVVNLCHQNYLSEYSERYHIPMVVSWTITKEELSNCNHREGSFHHDPMINGNDASPDSYNGINYDKGHFSPAEDNLFDPDAEYQSFNMTNVAPQVPELNRAGWKWFENLTRLYAYQYGEVDVTTGVVLSTNTYVNGIRVPDYFWKVDYIPQTGETISILVPNIVIHGKDILKYKTSVSNVENISHTEIPLPSNADKNSIGNTDNIDATAVEIRKARVCSIDD